MNLSLKIKPFSFQLLRSLNTSQGVLTKKEGWLLHLQTDSGNSGWGEVSPINHLELNTCEKIINSIETNFSRVFLEKNFRHFPGALRFGFGAALAEIDSLIDFETSQN